MNFQDMVGGKIPSCLCGERRQDRFIARALVRAFFETMEPPEQPIREEELLASKPTSVGNRRVRKKRARVDKEKMNGIELHRHNMRIRLMIALGVLVFFCILTGIVFWYPGTGLFRHRLDRMVVNSTGAKVEMENVGLSSFAISASRFDAIWPGGNFLHSLSVENLSGVVLPQRYFSRIFGGDELGAESGTLVLGHPIAGSPAVVTGEESGKSRVNFKRLGVSNLLVKFGDLDADVGARLVAAEVAFYPHGPAGVPRAMVYSGSLEIPSWPKFVLERAIVDFPSGSLRINGMRIRDKVAEINSEVFVGWADINGVFAHDSTTAAELTMELDGFQIQSLIGEEAGRFFNGRVNTRAGDDVGVIRISKEDGLQMRAGLVGSPLSEFTFSHFPFLGFISRAVDDRWFLNPVFDDGPSVVLIRDGEDMLFEDIEFVARRRMVIRGSMSINSEDAIRGEIEVGLSPTVIDASLARRLDGMFSAERDGFRWVTLELGGTTRMPTDNFNAQFIEAPMPEIEIPQLQPRPILVEPAVKQAPEPAKPDRQRRPTVLPLLDVDEE